MTTLPISVQLFAPVREQRRPSVSVCRQVEVRLMFGVSLEGGGGTLTTFMCFPTEKWKEKVALGCSSNLD